jgi:glycosyltransferase involved in cell wall biosynthesis
MDACTELLNALTQVAVQSELVIVDDGSNDETPDVALAIASTDSRVRVISHPVNRGLGGGYRTGFTEARGEFVTFFPADRQFPSEIILNFLPRMSDHDLVLGYLPKRDSSVAARLLSWGERLLYRLLFGAMPKFQGIFMFRRSLLQHIKLRSTGRGWAVVMEFILRVSRSGHRVVSVPTEMRPRSQGESKVNNFGTIVSNLRQTIALYREMKAP